MKKAPILRFVVKFLLAVWIVGTSTSLLFGQYEDQHDAAALGRTLPMAAASNNKTMATSSSVQSTTIPTATSTIDPPRFLLGIFSHDVYKMEASRRQMIRDTYLRYYLDHFNTTQNRICALRDLLDTSKTVTWKDCQLAYTFVTGGATQHNRTELLSTTTATTTNTTLSSEQMKLPHSESDVVALDIRENGEFGKSPTWFRYATLLIQEQNYFPVDYIIKTDSDTLLIPHRFFRWMDEQEQLVQYQRTRVYGGVPMDKQTCGWPHHDHCNNLTAPIYMGGALYLISLDVAQYVVSKQCPRSQLFLPHEDMAMANYVYSMNININMDMTSHNNGPSIRNFSHPDAYLNTWKHPVKDPKRMKSLWRKFVTKKRQRAKKNNAAGALVAHPNKQTGY
jgi:hypothetical protein